jgi:VanZ family protein
MRKRGSTDRNGSDWRRTALVAAVLFVGSVVPVPFGRHPEFEWFGPDKLLHLLGHGALAAATADALGGGRVALRDAALAVGLSAGYAVILGRVQERIPGREPERADLAASLLGATLGAVDRLCRSGETSRTTDE